MAGDARVQQAASHHGEGSCRPGESGGDREAGVESMNDSEEVCAISYFTWMVNVMVSLSPGPVSTIEP